MLFLPIFSYRRKTIVHSLVENVIKKNPFKILNPLLVTAREGVDDNTLDLWFDMDMCLALRKKHDVSGCGFESRNSLMFV